MSSAHPRRKHSQKETSVHKDGEDSTVLLNPWQNQNDKQEVQVREEGASLTHNSGADNLIL